MTQGRSYLAGLVTGLVVAGAVVFVGLQATAASETPAIETSAAAAPTVQAGAKMPEPAVKVLLENAQVRVREVTFAPGSGDTHTHQWAHVGVILTKGSLAFADAGKPEETVAFEAGSVGFREAKVTHLARNPGKTPMKVIEVEVK
jgi:mannose-6-phosphate isomerase-like protein (cupin superfamily)